MFGGNGDLFGFVNGNPKYPRGLGGSEPPLPRFDGWLAKKLFTFRGIFSCKPINFVPLGVCGLDLTPSTLWTSVDTNRASITIIID